MITTCLQLQLSRFLLVKGDQLFTRATVSLGLNTHIRTHTHAHIHTCTRDLCSILSASSSLHSMVPNTNQQIACLKKKKKKVAVASYIISPSSGQTLNIFPSDGFVFFLSLFFLSLLSLLPLALLLLLLLDSPSLPIVLSYKTFNYSHMKSLKLNTAIFKYSK